MEMRKYFELSDNENIISEILWDAAKAMLREKFIALNIYFFKRLKIHLMVCLPKGIYNNVHFIKAVFLIVQTRNNLNVIKNDK